MTLSLSMFLLGWTIQTLLQAQNSIQSPANGLPHGWPGIKRWLELQAMNLLGRLFVSVMLFPTILECANRLIGAWSLTPWELAGIAGYNCNALLNQISGLVPAFRVEIPQLAPPEAERDKKAEKV